MNGRCVYGDNRETMRAMIDAGERVQMCVTSPPYFGLRDYGTATWDGGDAGCDHKDARQTRGVNSPKQARQNGGEGGARGATCGRCGARRIDAQIGLEATVAEYVANMVDVFGLVREVLADDGTLWLNLGDSYGPGKQLLGIPWRVAFALQSDGWYLRSDIIWSKPNPMPESVTDRPTKAHEYLFLLSKRERYYYDAAAIAEAAECFGRLHTTGVQPPKVNALKASGHHGAGGDLSINYERETRNRRTVWTVATQPYSGAHFATFPPALIEPCILAGSREGDVVFDPFLGSGTTGEVATRLGRRWLGCELNEDYRPLIDERTAQLGLPLAVNA